MKEVVKVRMLPSEDQAVALEATLATCNEAASWLSAGMHAEYVYRKHEAHKQFYTKLEQQFGLSAQPAIRVIGKVAAAYAALRANIDAGNYGPPGSEKRRTVAATPIGFRTDPRDRRDRPHLPRRLVVSLRHRRGALGPAGPARERVCWCGSGHRQHRYQQRR